MIRFTSPMTPTPISLLRQIVLTIASFERMMEKLYSKTSVGYSASVSHHILYCYAQCLFTSSVSVCFPQHNWFSAYSISSQLTAYRQSISYQQTSPSLDWDVVLRRHVFPFWRRVSRHNEESPSMETLQSASLSMRAVKHLTDELNSTYAFIRSTRYHILLAHCFAWQWLESLCSYYSQPHVAKNADFTTWPSRLAQYIYIMLETRLATFTLCPADYLPYLPAEIQSFHTIGHMDYSILDCVPSLQQRVYLQMKHVLQKWLDFPQDDLADSRAWIVQNFIGVLGTGSLLLDETWEIYQHVPKYVLGRKSNRARTVFMHQLIPFYHHIDQCEAADKTSPARTMLDQYRLEHAEYGTGRDLGMVVARSNSIELVDSFQERISDGDIDAYGVDEFGGLYEGNMDVVADADVRPSPSIEVCLFHCP